MFAPSLEETRLIDHILAKYGCDEALHADSAIAALEASGLPPDILADIWDLVDDNKKGYLSKPEVGKAVRMIGWAQRGLPAQSQLIAQPGPLAGFEGIEAPEDNSSAFLILPPLSSTNRAKYESIFHRAGSEKDLLSASKVWETLIMSKLPIATLTRIWDLVDAQRRGSLTVTEFSIAMYLVHGLLEHHFATLPPSIPPYLYEQAEGLVIPTITTAVSPLPASDPRAGAFTTDFYIIRASVDLDSWIVPSMVKNYANSYFAALDTQERGFVDGNQTVPFLLGSGLPSEELERIWDLVDSTNKGHLTSEDFALALLLVYKELAGIEVPESLSCIARARGGEGFLSDPDKPHLPKRYSELPPLPPTPTDVPQTPSYISPGLSHELDLLHTQLDSMTQLRIRDRDTLQSQIQELHVSQNELVTENDELRKSLRNTTQSMRRSASIHADKSNSIVVENTDLRKQLRHMEEVQEQSRNTYSVSMLELTQENHLLQAKVESLASSLESRTADYDVQKLVIEEMTMEMERLRRRIADLRDESELVPSSDGDEDLQRMINEDLAKENRTLRTQVGQLAESLSELQTANAGMVQREEVENVRRRANRRIQEVEGRNAELARQVEEMTHENTRLRDETTRSAVDDAVTSQSEARHSDMPPPAYEAIGH